MTKKPSKTLVRAATHALFSETDWSRVDGGILEQIVKRPVEAGAAFVTFLNGAWEALDQVVALKPISDFDPEEHDELIGWRVVEHNARSEALGAIDLSLVGPAQHVQDGEEVPYAEWEARGNMSGNILLDIRLWEFFKLTPNRVPERIKTALASFANSLTFRGTILEDGKGRRGYPQMYMDDMTGLTFCVDWDDGEFITDFVFSAELCD